MKILYIGRYNFSEKLTGPEKVAKRIFDISSKKKDAVFLEYFFDGSVYGIWEKLFGYKQLEAKIHRIGLFRILNFILKFKPDIIHIITFERFAAIAYLVKMFLKTKIIYNVHGVAVYENKEFKNISFSLFLKDSFAEKIFFRKSDKLLFLSKFQLSIAKQFYEIENTKVQFVTNGVDEEFSAKHEVSVSNEKKSLVFIGDSERKDKDFNYLYSALSNINTACDLFVIGNYNTNKFSSKINNVNIYKVNTMDKTALVKFLSDKDIFISSSFYDTFSIATAECMSLGLVPIVTSNTGISELISDGENGFIVNHGDTSALAEKINLLLEDKNLRKKLSDNARKIYAILNWNKIYSSYEDIYKSEL